MPNEWNFLLNAKAQVPGSESKQPSKTADLASAQEPAGDRTSMTFVKTWAGGHLAASMASIPEKLYFRAGAFSSPVKELLSPSFVQCHNLNALRYHLVTQNTPDELNL
eukprot:1925360-Amphidinium_carterae.1